MGDHSHHHHHAPMETTTTQAAPVHDMSHHDHMDHGDSAHSNHGHDMLNHMMSMAVSQIKNKFSQLLQIDSFFSSMAVATKQFFSHNGP